MVAGHAKAVDDANLQLSPRVFLFTTALECEQEEGGAGGVTAAPPAVH